MGFLSDIGDAVSSAVDKATSAIESAASTALQVTADASIATLNGFGTIGKAFGDVTGDIFSAGYKLADGAIDFATENIPFADDAWNLFKDALNTTWNGAYAVGNATGEVLDDGVKLLGAATLKAYDIAAHPIRNAEEAVDTAKDVASSTWDKAKGLFD